MDETEAIKILGEGHIEWLDKMPIQAAINRKNGAWQANLLEQYEAYDFYIKNREASK